MHYEHFVTNLSLRILRNKICYGNMKTGKPQNPFLLSGYVSKEYFCDRESETQKLVSALVNGRNITLISPRRMGKTGLIRHTFHKMETEQGVHCYYVDLFQTDSLSSLVTKLGNVVLGTLDTQKEQLIKQVVTFFKSLRPVFGMDPRTGEPNFSINVQPELAEQSLEEILSYMEQSGKSCYVAFDEFQKITEYEDKKVEAILRSYIQHLVNVHFIFSGSQRHVLENMFASASRPFYQSTQMMNLGSIAEETYFEFAASHLKAHGQTIDAETFHYAYQKLYAHTWYVQMLLNRLYEEKISSIDMSAIDNELIDIVDDNEATFQTFLRLVTPAQRKILRAIAVEGKVKEISGRKFITAHHLGAASTVASAVKSLVDKELILDEQGTYSVYDRFLGLYLLKKS